MPVLSHSVSKRLLMCLLLASCCLLLKYVAHPGPYQDCAGAYGILEKRLIFTSKWTTAWHHSVRDASLHTIH